MSRTTRTLGTLTAEAADPRDVLAATQPLYQQLYDYLYEQISAGILGTGDRLPGERELCKRFGVGRSTVRRALAELGRDGQIESFVGRGTFVSAGPVSETNALTSLTDLAHARGLSTSSHVLSAALEPAQVEEAEMFGVAPGSPMFHLERVRLLDGYEFAVAKSVVPQARVPGVEAADYATASLYATLTALGAEPTRADYTVWAAPSDERMARLLAIDPGTAVFMSSTSTYDAAKRLVATSVVAYRADRYRMRTVLSKPRRQPNRSES